MSYTVFLDIFNSLVDAIAGIGGIIIGALLGYIYFRKKEQDKFSRDMYFRYQELAKELAICLQTFLPLTLKPQGYRARICQEVDRELSSFFFKYYLILPQSVLEEISCMHACLQHNGDKIFIVDKSNEIPLIRSCEYENETLKFFEEVTIFRTKKNWAEIYLKYKRVPRYIALRCQARHAIAAMQAAWQYEDMYSWRKQMKKRSLAQMDKIYNKNDKK